MTLTLSPQHLRHQIGGSSRQLRGFSSAIVIGSQRGYLETVYYGRSDMLPNWLRPEFGQIYVKKMRNSENSSSRTLEASIPDIPGTQIRRLILTCPHQVEAKSGEFMMFDDCLKLAVLRIPSALDAIHICCTVFCDFEQ